MTRPLEPRPGYDELRVYSPGQEQPCAIDLSDNTNQWGMAPAAAAALASMDPQALTRYPEPYAGSLKEAIAAHVGVTPDMVVTGTGSDGVLEPAIRAFARPDGRMVLADPTFVMAASFGRMNGLTPAPVPLRADYDIDAAAMVEADGCVTYLCAPNNPTGTEIAPGSMAHVVANAPGLVIVDEAYVEFAPSSALELAKASDRVLLLRTFSKAFSLAGLRVGYGIGAPSLVAAVEKARGPYTVGALSERAALAVLADTSGWVPDHVREAIAARKWLTGALKRLGLEPARSCANFVFVPVRDATAIAAELAAGGIRIRAFAGVAQVSPALVQSVGEALRITVGPAEMLEPAVAALERALAARNPA